MGIADKKLCANLTPISASPDSEYEKASTIIAFSGRATRRPDISGRRHASQEQKLTTVAESATLNRTMGIH